MEAASVADGPTATSAVLRDAAGIGRRCRRLRALVRRARGRRRAVTVLQACALSLLMFTGASQFAFVGVIGGGGSLVAGA